MHEIYMKRALELALNGWGTTNPNPLVGAVIVKDGWVIGEGFHERRGQDHAEVAALKNAKQELHGSTLYVNLEPCSHFGKTPPCAKAIIESGVSKVVIGMTDPNPLVAGEGIRMLNEAGIETEVGILENQAKKLNEIFIKYITEKKPFVILKSAMSLDGKICTYTGDSKWISGEESRKYVHHVRNRVSAIMVGTNTIIKDNPSLTTRLEGEKRDAHRIILDRTGRIPIDSKVFNTSPGVRVIVATSETAHITKNDEWKSRGAEVLVLPETNTGLDLNYLMDRLYELEIDSVLIEGGGSINFSAVQSGIVDKYTAFISPIIIGGDNALTPVDGKGFEDLQNSMKLKNISTKAIGEDILIEGYFHNYFEVDKGEGCVHGHCGGNGCCHKC
jgi:diaminohydroxyphosphoribosylaminopyrimidine deaminase/5-amino-6-(5-phosphoribosylamino)uracil reductase